MIFKNTNYLKRMAYLTSLYNPIKEIDNKKKYEVIYEDKIPILKYPTIAATVMVKNEEENIIKTLSTCLGAADLVIILDTGSTDKTIELAKEFSRKNNLPFFCIKSEWINDFSYSRNILLDYSDDKADYLLLYDANDELKEAKKLKQYIRSNHNNPKIKGYYVEQEWKNGDQLDNFKNVKLTKTKQKWKYYTPIHEYIFIPDLVPENVPSIETTTGIKYYQDRKEDNKRTMKRQERDKEILYNLYLKNPYESRTLFYLAQTLAACHEFRQAYIFYQRRLKHLGHSEEVFLSYVKCGELAVVMNHGWEECETWFLKAFQYMPRIEPLIRIVTYYYSTNKNLHMAYMYCRTAIQLAYPDSATLFVSTYFYNYLKWHLYAKICYDLGLKQEAFGALQNIVKFGNKCDLDLAEAIVTKNEKFKNEATYKFNDTKLFNF